MVLLDTNVLAAMMRADPPPPVAAWMARQPAETLFTTAICQADILAGIAILPEGRRRDALEAAARAMFAEDFSGRVLPFDAEAATAYAVLLAARRRVGRPGTPFELMIAAIALARDMAVVTRDSGGFRDSGLAVIDPWAA